jgi:hypothetical protein
MSTLIAKINERIQAPTRRKNDAAPVATIATIRPALGDVFFPAKAQTAIAATTGFYLDASFIDEFHGFTGMLTAQRKKPRSIWQGFACASGAM